MKSWWEVKKKTASHVTQVNYDNHVPDNIVDNAQRDSDETVSYTHLTLPTTPYV